MADETVSWNLFNPVMLWADMGLRALEMSVASTQTMGDSLDRVARASAGADVEVIGGEPASVASAPGPAAAAGSGLALATQVQRSAFELLTQNWVQCMSTLGTIASLAAAGGSSAPASTRKVALDSVRWGLQSAATSGPPALQAWSGGPSNQQSATSREGQAQTRTKEHAAASAKPARRRSTGAAKRKPRGRSA